jgi:hypothetical protein
LRVFLEVAEALEALLVAQLDPAQVEHGVLHQHRDLLSDAGFLPGDQRGEQADQQVDAGVGIAKGRGADGGWSVPEACGGGRAAGTLCDVFIDLQVGPARLPRREHRCVSPSLQI